MSRAAIRNGERNNFRRRNDCTAPMKRAGCVFYSAAPRTHFGNAKCLSQCHTVVEKESARVSSTYTNSRQLTGMLWIPSRECLPYSHDNCAIVVSAAKKKKTFRSSLVIDSPSKRIVFAFFTQFSSPPNLSWLFMSKPALHKAYASHTRS